MPQSPTHEMTGDGSIPEPFVPEPTAQSYEDLKIRQATFPVSSPGPIPIPIPHPFIFGSRFLIWKQDPTVGVPGRRLAYIQGLQVNGPRDSRVGTNLPGTTPVVRNANGDFVFAAGTPEADCAQTYAVVRQTLAMYERLRGGAKIPWTWNAGGNTSVITTFPRGFASANAYYSRNQKALKFGGRQRTFGRSPLPVAACDDVEVH